MNTPERRADYQPEKYDDAGRQRSDYQPALYPDTPRPTMTQSEPVLHAHSWVNAATVREHKVEHSPVSHGDCAVYDQVVITQSCPCGEFRRVIAGYENEKRGCW